MDTRARNDLDSAKAVLDLTLEMEAFFEAFEVWLENRGLEQSYALPYQKLRQWGHDLLKTEGF